MDRDFLRLKVIVKSEEVGDDVDKLVFSAPKVRNEFCLWANELAYAMNCPTGMNCAAAHKE